ncbi:MarR family winged helix-turn-helix transcriptional regulator [Actinomycetospora chiangmaiensis]|uniref:MarR family winged helix-turn-helix transcriptional regulator n=1 Tax=Actinomycetospora chiangmaiensis TaxID=402650 RepID=UPI00035E6AB5|nr:MarR family transcriptional regulator [Actinomycetospora chiangmaiensis]
MESTAIVEVFDDLVRVQIVLWEAVDRRVRRDLDLPLGRVEALRAVVRVPSCRVQDISTALHVTVGAASKLTDRLVAGGLVVRVPHPEDRRSSVLTPTPAGRETHDRAEAVVADELRHHLGGDDLAVLTPGLAALRARLTPR